MTMVMGFTLLLLIIITLTQGHKYKYKYLILRLSSLLLDKCPPTPVYSSLSTQTIYTVSIATNPVYRNTYSPLLSAASSFSYSPSRLTIPYGCPLSISYSSSWPSYSSTSPSLLIYSIQSKAASLQHLHSFRTILMAPSLNQYITVNTSITTSTHYCKTPPSLESWDIYILYSLSWSSSSSLLGFSARKVLIKLSKNGPNPSSDKLFGRNICTASSTSFSSQFSSLASSTCTYTPI